MGLRFNLFFLSFLQQRNISLKNRLNQVHEIKELCTRLSEEAKSKIEMLAWSGDFQKFT
jgi:hypothetical protein